MDASAIQQRICVLRCGAIFRNFFCNYKPTKWMLMPSSGNLWYQGFRLQFLLPSSGEISNVSTTIFASIFRENIKFKIIKFLKALLNVNLKNFLKMESKTLVETFEIFPEDGSKNCGRKPQYRKLLLDGASIHFIGLQFQKKSERWRHILVHKFPNRWC